MASRIYRLYEQMWTRIIRASQIDEASITAFRRLFVVVSLLLFIPNDLWLAAVPKAIYRPPILSVAALFSDFPSIEVLWILHITVIAALVVLGLGRCKRAAGLVFFVSLIVLEGFRYSFGKIDHAILYPMVALCFSLNDWSSLKQCAAKKNCLPIPSTTLLAIVLSFGMFTAGFQKALNWVDFDMEYSGFLNWFYAGYYNSGRTYLLAPLVFKLPAFLIELFDYLAVVFELSPFLLLLLGRKSAWKIWLLTAAMFHLLVTLFLNIPFWASFLVYMPFLMPRFLVRFLVKLPARLYASVIVCIAILQLLLLFTKQQTIHQYLMSTKEMSLFFSLSCWLLILALGVLSWKESLFSKGETISYRIRRPK